MEFSPLSLWQPGEHDMSARITLLLLAYNHCEFIEAAARSTLLQACEPIEIIMSDDCSSDDTYARMQAIAQGYSGPHQVVVRRNETNLGIGRHLNALMRLAGGRLVVLMAGDDISLPTRVARNAQAWDASNQRLDLLASHVVDMSHDGKDLGVLRAESLQQWKSVDDWAQRRPYVIGAAHAITRRLFDRFGPLQDDVSHEDQVNVLRAVCSGGACTIDEPLVRYRRGGISAAFDHSPLAFRTFEAQRNARHFAVFAQWKRDASVAGCRSLVENAIADEEQGEIFVRRLLAASSLSQQLRLAAAASGLNAKQRWKKLSYLRAPRATLVFKRLKARWHARRIPRP